MINMKINIFWFRRDLRLTDNIGLYNALNSGLPVLLLFIFDTNITDELQHDDPRISFIYETLSAINKELNTLGSSLLILNGKPETIWKELITSFEINKVYINKDYEPYAIQRDEAIEMILRKNRIPLFRFKDQVIFEERDILKPDDSPYTIFTPYKNQWLKRRPKNMNVNNKNPKNYFKFIFDFPPLKKTGFSQSHVKVRPYDLSVIKYYDKYRDIPAADLTTYLSPHLRFGTVSIRNLVNISINENHVFLGELIWREFFMQILFNFPRVVTGNFRTKYDNITWRNDENEFDRWCHGETGYPIVDAGMRQLNKTGYMHNRVRMITAGFLCKHLLIDWRWGEAYFASKLLDYELSSNNGNWQWAAGTGCDAAPYFRIFNPSTQQNKFDKNELYLNKWCSDFKNQGYPEPIVDHDFARKRAIEAYKVSNMLHS